MDVRYTQHENYKTCKFCDANLDHGEICDCLSDSVKDLFDKFVLKNAEDTEKALLNAHGKYVLKFAKNHNLTIAEAHNHPTVKAHLAFYNSDIGQSLLNPLA